MVLSVIEILAIILIVLTIIKLVVILISPKSWMKFAKSIYKDPQITSWIAFVLAAVVLYYLVKAGITITEILAVFLFLALVFVTGVARYMPDLMKWAEKRKLDKILKDQWLMTAIWILLIIWGIKEIFF